MVAFRYNNLTLFLSLQLIASVMVHEAKAAGGGGGSIRAAADDYDEEEYLRRMTEEEAAAKLDDHDLLQEEKEEGRNLQFMFPTFSPATMNAPYVIPPLPDKLTLDYDPANPYVAVKATGGGESLSWWAAHDYCRDELHSELASIDKVDAGLGSQTEQIVALDSTCQATLLEYGGLVNGKSYVCHIGLRHDRTTSRFLWANGQLLAPTSGQLIPPDTVVSKTSFGYHDTTLVTGTNDLGTGSTPSENSAGEQVCVSSRFTYNQATASFDRKGWMNHNCPTHSEDMFLKSVFVCKNPFFGIDSCSSDNDCGDNGDCVNGKCVPSASAISPGRTCDNGIDGDYHRDCPVDDNTGSRITCLDAGHCACSEDSDCSTGACLAGTCVAQGSVGKGGYCDSDAECAGSSICNLKAGVNKCDSRLPRGIKLSFCSMDSQCNQSGTKWSVCDPTSLRCETPVGGWCTFDYYCVSGNCDTTIRKCID